MRTHFDNGFKDQNCITEWWKVCFEGFHCTINLVNIWSVGKTSLCRGLAQKLSIQLNERFTHCQLVEINSHSLFSKWFSESGKLVQKMFDRVRELAADRNALICILIDEVSNLYIKATNRYGYTNFGSQYKFANDKSNKNSEKYEQILQSTGFDINRRMPNCTTVLQTTSDLFQLEI